MPNREKKSLPVSTSIVLVGMMGCGKTKVGSLLARTWGMRFVDSDKLIQERTGQSIADIFATQGEDAFREIEHRVILELICGTEPLVLSTGGGAFMHETTRAAIQKNAVSVYLDASLPILIQRLDHPSKRKFRPLLKGENWKTVLETRLREREPIYKRASYVVRSDESSLEKMVQRIENALLETL